MWTLPLVPLLSATAEAAAAGRRALFSACPVLFFLIFSSYNITNSKTPVALETCDGSRSSRTGWVWEVPRATARFCSIYKRLMGSDSSSDLRLAALRRNLREWGWTYVAGCPRRSPLPHHRAREPLRRYSGNFAHLRAAPLHSPPAGQLRGCPPLPIPGIAGPSTIISLIWRCTATLRTRTRPVRNRHEWVMERDP